MSEQTEGSKRRRTPGSGGNKKGQREGFGSLRKLPSERWQARYIGPDKREHRAPTTFRTKAEARNWLSLRRADITLGKWMPEQRAVVAPLTFGEFAEKWLAHRELRPRTVSLYRRLLDRLILPTFAEVPLRDITREAVRDWHATLDRSKPTQRAHAFGLLRTVLGSAVEDELIPANPAQIRGAGQSKRASQTRPATLPELEVMVREMPQGYGLMLLLACWCSLRFGEVIELRRGDIDLAHNVVRVRRAVTRVDGVAVVGLPKSDAGVRDVAIPPHLVEAVREHLRSDITGGRDGLLFPAAGDPAKHLHSTTTHRWFKAAREAAGRPDLRFHDLRHTGATMAAQTGATLAELMARLGHSTPAAAMKYQHAGAGRDAQIAAALSVLAQQQSESAQSGG